MSVRERVLVALQQLVLEGDAAPTLDRVAAAAGVSKGGLLHHFPDRRSMLHALVVRVVEQTDELLTRAARDGRVAESWLRLSAEVGPQQETTRAILSLTRLTADGTVDLPPEVGAATERWRRLIADEIGDPVRAEVVRLVGDGLFLQALSGGTPTATVDAVVAHLLGEET